MSWYGRVQGYGLKRLLASFFLNISISSSLLSKLALVFRPSCIKDGATVRAILNHWYYSTIPFMLYRHGLGWAGQYPLPVPKCERKYRKHEKAPYSLETLLCFINSHFLDHSWYAKFSHLPPWSFPLVLLVGNGDKQIVVHLYVELLFSKRNKNHTYKTKSNKSCMTDSHNI